MVRVNFLSKKGASSILGERHAAWQPLHRTLDQCLLLVCCLLFAAQSGCSWLLYVMFAYFCRLPSVSQGDNACEHKLRQGLGLGFNLNIKSGISFGCDFVLRSWCIITWIDSCTPVLPSSLTFPKRRHKICGSALKKLFVLPFFAMLLLYIVMLYIYIQYIVVYFVLLFVVAPTYHQTYLTSVVAARWPKAGDRDKPGWSATEKKVVRQTRSATNGGVHWISTALGQHPTGLCRTWRI